MEDLYAKYSKDFRKVVDNVFGEEYPELADQLRANVSRFAAYKSNYVKTAFEDNSKAFSGDDLKAANEASKNQFRSWTETELATASARARTAKQFSEFNEPDRKELFPCLKWLPSRAVNPRQSHQDFYDKVWRKDDKFWQKYCPGTEWGCMCDLEECDEEPSHIYPKNYNAETGDVKESEEEKKKNRGIKLDNPYHSGRIFTDEVGYIAKANKNVEKIALNLTRSQVQNWAIKNKELLTVHSANAGFDIKFSTRGIKEYLNQPHDDYLVKNEMLYRISEVLKGAEYMGETIYKNRKSHIFKTNICNKENYIIILERNEGFIFHSITNSNKVLQ